MGYKRDGIGFLAEWWDERDGRGDWLTNDVVSRCLFAPLREAGWLGKADQLSIDVGEPVAIESLAQLEALAPSWHGKTVAMFAGDMHDPDWRFHISLSPASVRISLGLGAALVTGGVRERIAGWVARWSALLGERRCWLSIGAVAPPELEFPRPRPPRTSLRYRLGALDHYFGRAWHLRTAEGTATLAAIEQAALPPGIARSCDGDVVRVAFPVDDLGDPVAVAAALAASYLWVTPLVPTEVKRGWNELGDRIVVAVRPVDLPPFTLYDEHYQVGYKALIADPRTGEVDDEVWAELAAIARAGRHPDGTPVTAVRLVFPVRDNALLVHDRAIADGFEMVTYPGDGVFWQVNPP